MTGRAQTTQAAIIYRKTYIHSRLRAIVKLPNLHVFMGCGRKTNKQSAGGQYTATVLLLIWEFKHCNNNRAVILIRYKVVNLQVGTPPSIWRGEKKRYYQSQINSDTSQMWIIPALWVMSASICLGLCVVCTVETYTQLYLLCCKVYFELCSNVWCFLCCVKLYDCLVIVCFHAFFLHSYIFL